MFIRDALLKDLTREQISKARACQNGDELLRLAREEGVELSAEQLEAVNGGGCFSSNECPSCGSKDYTKEIRCEQVGDTIIYTCKHCGRKWKI